MFNLTYKSVSVMKKSKDTLTSQLTTAEKTNLVACLKTLGITHIDLDVVMDDNSVILANGTTPSPRTVEAEIQDWVDVIHAAGLKVIFRGTFCGVESIYNFSFDTATSLGTASSAPTDGNTTWCGRYYNFLYNHIGSHIQSGDILAPIPEPTTHAFDGHWFVSSEANFRALFASFHTITNTYAAAKGVTLQFFTANNFSEAASGYIGASMFSDEGIVGADYYGQRQGTVFNNFPDYIKDWQQLYLGKDSNGGGGNNAGGVNQFWMEWGDLPNALPPMSEMTVEHWSRYLINFYKALRDNLVPPNGNLVGFSYWGGWEGQNTSLLWKTGSGSSSQYFLNFRGQTLAAFFKSQVGLIRNPVIIGGTSFDTYYF